MENRWKSVLEKGWKPPKLKHGKPTKYGWWTYHPEHIEIGKLVDIGSGCRLFGHHWIFIEDNVSIGGGCYLYTYNSINNEEGSILIKKGAKIGALTLILPGVRIEEDEYIPARSIVYMKNGVRVIK